MSCRPACSLPETTPLALASLSWGNDNIPLKKADSFGFEPQKRWVNLVGGTSKDRMDQYPRPVRANRRGHFQGETDAPMSGGLRADASNFLILSKLVPGSCGGDYVRRRRLLQGDLAARMGVKAENVVPDQQGDAPEWFRHEVFGYLRGATVNPGRPRAGGVNRSDPTPRSSACPGCPVSWSSHV